MTNIILEEIEKRNKDGKLLGTTRINISEVNFNILAGSGSLEEKENRLRSHGFKQKHINKAKEKGKLQ